METNRPMALAIEPLERRRLLASDAFEDNDSLAQAFDLGNSPHVTKFEGLTIERIQGNEFVSDDDYFKWVAPASGELYVEILFRDLGIAGMGNLDLEIYSRTRGFFPFTLFAKSDSLTDNERVRLDVAMGQSYIIRVFGPTGWTHDDYDLVVAPLLPDRFEQNDSFGQTADLGSTSQVHENLTIERQTGKAFTSDPDFYLWTAPSNGILTVQILFDDRPRDGEGNLDLILFEGPTQIASSLSTTDDEIIQSAVTPGTAYTIQVFGAVFSIPIFGSFNWTHYDYDLVIDFESTNSLPTISSIADLIIDDNSVAGPIAFTIGDAETPASQLTISAQSSNPRLVSDSDIVFGGGGGNRTVSITPIPFEIGTSTITITVSDADGALVSEAFQLSVRQLLDSDGDGLPDVWETLGINGFSLKALGADPLRKDVFVEVDAMAGRAPSRKTLERVIEAFANAPVTNPNGTTGIKLHIELDETSIPTKKIPADRNLSWVEFDDIKSRHFGAPAQRLDPAILQAKKLVYRYGLFGNTMGQDGVSGLSEVPGDDFLVTLGDWKTKSGQRGGTPDQQAGTFMHELGHTLGLGHGGGDTLDNKPNYFSVMNRHWQVPTKNLGWQLDYSRVQIDLDENHLDERGGVGFSSDGVQDDHQVHIGPGFVRRVPLVGQADFNGDGTLSDNIPFDVSADGVLTQLDGHEDWTALVYEFRIPTDTGFGTRCPEEECKDEITAADHANRFSTFEVDEFEPNDDDAAAHELDEGDQLVENLTIHESGNEDWFSWVSLFTGVLSLDVFLQQDEPFELDFSLFGPNMDPLEDQDLDPTDDHADFVVQQGSRYLLRVFSQDFLYYGMEFNGPEIWNGQGDGRHWTDATNWLVDGGAGGLPNSGDNVSLSEIAGVQLIDLSGDRTVHSISAIGNYTITGGRLAVDSGLLNVTDGATATFESDVTSPSDLRKIGEGALHVNGKLNASVFVEEGTLGGTGNVDSLVLSDGTTLAPGNSIGVFGVGNATIAGTLQIEVSELSADLLSATGSVLFLQSDLHVDLLEKIKPDGFGTETRTVSMASSLSGAFTRINGQLFPENPSVDLGLGVFLQDVSVDSRRVDVEFLQAAAGDSNADRQFDQFDLILVQQFAKYKTGQRATWREGDWNLNGVFDQFDIIEALKAARYLKGPYA